MKKIIIVADLGHFKAYEVSKNPMESPRIELKKSYDIIEAHGKLGDKLSDEAGRFGVNGGKKGIKGYGEPHNIKLENKKRLIKQIAGDINDLIKRARLSRWYLAASKNINNQLIENLEPSVRTRLEKNVMADLTKKHKSEILDYFK
jgi:hypothetical protein